MNHLLYRRPFNHPSLWPLLVLSVCLLSVYAAMQWMPPNQRGEMQDLSVFAKGLGGVILIFLLYYVIVARVHSQCLKAVIQELNEATRFITTGVASEKITNQREAMTAVAIAKRWMPEINLDFLNRE